jgi:ABC-type Fe3+-hydroxamate transport system substrate-binding protein
MPVCSVDLRLVEKVVKDMQDSSSSNSSSNGTAAAVQQAPRIVSLNPFNIEDVLQDALVVGEALGLQSQAAAAVAALRARVGAALSFVAQQPPLAAPVVAFLEWFEPLFPGGHWTPQLIHMAGEGLVNVINMLLVPLLESPMCQLKELCVW